MTYTKQVWSDLPSEETPLTAERLNHIENGISDLESEMENLSQFTYVKYNGDGEPALTYKDKERLKTNDYYMDMNTSKLYQYNGSEFILVGNVDDLGLKFYIVNDKLYYGGYGADSFSEIQPKFPVGYIYLSVNDTNPKDIFGYGTWERIAKGRTLVGVDEDDTDFNKSKLELGEKEHILTVDEMPSHSHRLTEKLYNAVTNGYGTFGQVYKNNTSNESVNIDTSSIGGDKPHNNIQPSYTVYMFERIA